MRTPTKLILWSLCLLATLALSTDGEAFYDDYEKMTATLQEEYPDDAGWKPATNKDVEMFEWSFKISLGSDLKEFLKGGTTEHFTPLLIQKNSKGQVEKIVGYLHVKSKMQVVNDTGEWVKESREYWEVFGIHDPDKGWITAVTPQQNYALAEDAFGQCQKGVQKSPISMVCGDDSFPLDTDGDLQPGPTLSDAEVYAILNADAKACVEEYDVDSDLWFLTCPDGSSKVIKKNK